MKKLLIIVMIMLSSCALNKIIKEDTLYVTKKYCGRLLSTNYIESGKYRRTTQIITDEAQFHVKGNVQVPDSVRCYFKMKETIISAGESVVWMVYFTYDGTDDLYFIIQNFITGRIY